MTIDPTEFTQTQWADKQAKISVGDEVVIFSSGYPLQHNSSGSLQHPCRGTVVKKGRKLIHISSNGAPWTVRIDGTGRDTALIVPDAKEYYLANFMANRAYRTTKFVEECVDKL